MEQLTVGSLNRSRLRQRLAPGTDRAGASRFPAGIIALGLAGAGALCLPAVLAGADPDLLLVGAALVVTAVPFSLAAIDAPDRLIHPLTMLGFSMLLGVAGQTAFLVLFASPAEHYDLLAGVGHDGLTRGLLVVAAGTVALAFGFIASGPRSVARPGRFLRWATDRGLARPSIDRMTWIVASLCLVSVVSIALYAPRVGIASIGDLLVSRKRFAEVEGGVTALGYHRFGMSLAGIGFLLAVYTLAVCRAQLRSGLGMLAGLALALAVISAFAVSGRATLFLVVAAAGLAVVAVRGREPKPGRVAVAVLAAFAILTLLLALRGVSRGESLSLSEAIAERGPARGDVAERDWMSIGPISAVVVRVPERYDYQYGRTLISAVWAPVPRTIWPEKPPVRLGPEIGPPVFEFPHRRRSGSPPGLLGELWLNGGILAVLLGMTIFGAILRWVERWNRLTTRTDGLAGLLYAVLAAHLALRLPNSDVTGIVISLIGIAAVVLPALWIARTRQPVEAV